MLLLNLQLFTFIFNLLYTNDLSVAINKILPQFIPFLGSAIFKF